MSMVCYFLENQFCKSLIYKGEMVLQERIELSTSPLPRECSTTELLQRRRLTLSCVRRGGIRRKFDLAQEPGAKKCQELLEIAKFPGRGAKARVRPIDSGSRSRLRSVPTACVDGVDAPS